jgi:subtilase family serine protease
VATNGNAVVTCTGDLPALQSTTVTIPLTVQAAAPPLLTVKITADPMNAILETNEANNVQTETTSVTHVTCNLCIDLVAGQVIATDNPTVNDKDVTYQFVVTNIGDLSTETDSPPRTVVVAVNLDGISNELSLVSSSATNGFTCATNPAFPGNPAAPELLCSGPAAGLAPGGGTEVTVVAHANTAPANSFVGFDVSVDPADDITEFNEANNASSLVVNTVAP